MSKKRDPEGVVRESKRKTRRRFPAEEKIRTEVTELRRENDQARWRVECASPGRLESMCSGA